LKKTRDKIISTAIQEFNAHGYAAVNLRELSVIIGVSRGNLTYHFKDKETLLEAIVNEMWDNISAEMSKTLELPSFENMRNRTRLYYEFQKRYAFIFLDIHVQSHPAIHERFKQMIEDTIENYMQMIALGIQLGTVKAEEIPGTYKSLVHAVWMTSFYRLAQQHTRGISEDEDTEMLIWGLVLPHLTKKGVKAFKKYFGGDYYDQLGHSFDVKEHAFISF